MATHNLTTPLSDDQVASLTSGDIVYISGVIYAARDAAHKKLIELINAGKELPFDIRGQIIYYVGPTPAAPGKVIGSAGPTTSGRMDAYAPALLERGLKGMIGKGSRSDKVKEYCRKHGAVYFAATGGAGALIAKTITAAEVVAYEELGAEAIRKLTVNKLPVVVINDTRGGDLYIEGRKKYSKTASS